ncbi:MAG TPA: bifunctional (p)ppGpp synthetase/guanosine-3',5'-bis(diphosphate) 3'-pyrophosphohydrolase [Clostridia bacterium]|nr:bifunctional (p)ppGpp synthetase/guanosine-3',5'-bis(diphosphate) 3'-pyrophosphohydrolase [Clostridia bacterium]
MEKIQQTTEKLLENLKSKARYYYQRDYDLIMDAYDYAAKAHLGQFRASGNEYITHPLQVADILMDLGLDTAAVCAALLHDTVEDTVVSDEDIRNKFGNEIADLVKGVTKLEKLHFNNAEEEQAENIRKMFFAMSKDIRVLFIKLADRLHNMRSLGYLTKEKQINMAKETREIYAPLAGRLGISPVKCELEDLALKYLDRESYDYLAKNIALKKEERQALVDSVIAEIYRILEETDVDEPEISGRTKHFYSIYKKMRSQNKTLDQIYDMTAVRIIVNSVKDCYTVLGAIHARWKPVPGRFKDYIAVPKPNLYQSLHTTVITNFGVPFEIQIRTHEMHKIAEYGIAAHWKYKEGVKGVTELDDKLTWVQDVLNYETDLKDSKEFLDYIRKDISISNEVYVFTPKGDVRAISAGATALDFAYMIHSEVGNRCVGTKVNGKIVPLDKIIQTGDVIEVLTNPNSKGPSRDWLKIVKTSGAKAKIRQFFKRELKDENIKTGKSMLEREAKRRGYTLSELLTDEAEKAVCDRYMFNTLDELYAALGYGGLSINQVIFKLLAANVANGSIQEDIPVRKHKHSAKENSVIIKGAEDILVRFSGCCSPVPGDEIIGYVSRGRGVSVHRKDCPAVKTFEKERLVEAEWAKVTTEATFSATLQIISEDKGGVFADITRVIANENLPLLSINARKDPKTRNAVATVTVDIENNEQVALLVAKLNNLPNTIKVFRTTK